jgi:hypothetical protein
MIESDNPYILEQIAGIPQLAASIMTVPNPSL